MKAPPKPSPKERALNIWGFEKLAKQSPLLWRGFR